MAHREQSLTAGDRLRSVLANELLWALGEAAPQREVGSPGRPREHPEWTWFLYCAEVTIHTSARKAAGEIAGNWSLIVEAARDRYPDNPEMWANPEPPSRHHWQYAKKRLRLEPVLRESITVFEAVSALQATEAGIADPALGSISHPHPLNALTGDGKVITPLYRAKRRTRIVDKETGEILGVKKADPDAQLHITGGGHPAYGNKFVMLAGRTPDWHGRMILSLDYVPDKGGEARVALDCLERIIWRLPGAQAFIYDGALRGSHVRQVLRDSGIIPVSPPTAAKAETDDQKREEKVAFIEVAETSTGEKVNLYALGGQIGIGEIDADGEEVFEPLERKRILKRRNTDGSYRWYGTYQLPADRGGDIITVRADTTADDQARKINRSENYRLIPPGDPDYAELYPLRSDIEANNRQLEDTLWINRAHSVGAPAQLLDLLGYALVYNSVAIGLARARAAEAVAA